MRDSALAFVYGLFVEEVEALCGPAFSRKGADGYHRGGSDPGSVILEGQRLKVKKARIKKGGKDVELQSYAALQGFDLLQDRVLNHMLRGVSTRDYEPLLDEVSGGLGLKKSSVSKAFIRGSRQALDSINGRDLSGHQWAALMIDGIEFADASVIVVLGITVTGKKLILGLKRGDTENSETVKDLLQELVDRGLKHDEPFLLVLDGSKALRKAVRQVFGDSFPVQRCVRHKERNALAYLPKSDHPEFRRRWKLIHGMARYSEALQHLENLVNWLRNRNLEAAASVEEAEGETLTLVKLGASAALRKTLLSTNPIESGFDKVRSKTNRVRRWRKRSDQIERWTAASLQVVEKGFRSIRGAKDLPALIAEIRRKNLPTQAEAA
jgi:transposase-like protein